MFWLQSMDNPGGLRGREMMNRGSDRMIGTSAFQKAKRASKRRHKIPLLARIGIKSRYGHGDATLEDWN